MKVKIGSKANNGFYVFKIIIAKNMEDAREVNNNPLLSGIAHNPVKFYTDSDELDVFVFFTDGRSSSCQHYLKYILENDITLT